MYVKEDRYGQKIAPLGEVTLDVSIPTWLWLAAAGGGIWWWKNRKKK